MGHGLKGAIDKCMFGKKKKTSKKPAKAKKVFDTDNDQM